MNAVAQVQQSIAGLQARQTDLETQIAADFDGKAADKLAQEHATITAKLPALMLLLKRAEQTDHEAAVADMLARYRANLAALHTAYGGIAEIDEAQQAHQREIEALNRQRAPLNETVQLTSGRRARLMAEAQQLGISNADLDAIRREFAPIAKYF